MQNKCWTAENIKKSFHECIKDFFQVGLEHFFSKEAHHPLRTENLLEVLYFSDPRGRGLTPPSLNSEHLFESCLIGNWLYVKPIQPFFKEITK